MANHETIRPLPPRWSDDPLTSFIGHAFANILATFVGKPERFRVLLRIDESFMRIGENLVNPPDILAAVLLLRSHSAYRGACRLAMSGQAPDTYPLLRSCLEYALYALHINTLPHLGEVWLHRHDDSDALKLVRRNFTNVGVLETLRRRDGALCDIVENLYERTVDFGGHPNERAITGSMTIQEEKGRTELAQIYLHSDSLALEHVLKTTAQIGLGSICILQHIFRERFDILGLRDVIDQLRSEL